MNRIYSTLKNIIFIKYITLGTLVMILFYFITMLIFTRSISVTINQFIYYKVWILMLAVGFGIQFGLVKFLHLKNISKLTKTTGTTTTATMVACCMHHIVDLFPILGLSAIASFLGIYTIHLFILGILINLFAIIYIIFQIKKNYD